MVKQRNSLLLILALFLLLCWQSSAQENPPIVLTLQLLEGMDYLDDGTIFTDFEAAHPGVDVHVVYKTIDFDADYIPQPVNGLNEHLDAVDRYTMQADVLTMSVGEGITELSLEATRAGYILDLAPLFNGDSTADPSVYYPTVWQATQWDGGLWILPTSTTISTIVYDARIFDEAALSYPDESWDAADYAHAAELLAVRDESGMVVEPSYVGFNGNDGALVYRLLGRSLYDATEFPYQPDFLNDATLELASHWLPALSSGAMFNFHHDYGSTGNTWSDIAFSIDWLSIAYLNDLQFAPMPGGGGLVNINGLVVSSRSQHPQLAYELASYLAANRLIADAMQMNWAGQTLARPDYGEVDEIELGSYMIDMSTEEARLLMADVLNNGIPASELLFYPYFQNALFLAAEGTVDIETALRDAETLALNNLEIAEARRSEITGTIPTPIPEIVLAPDEIELTVYYAEGDSLLWAQFGREFAATDSEVARVVLRNYATGVDYREEGVDCFYHYGSLAQSAPEYFTDMAPLLAVDENFAPEDWLTGVFENFQQGDSIYALPMDIRPLALWVDSAQLEAAGLQIPQTQSEFLDALAQLGNPENPPLAAYDISTALLMLMASRGAILIDYNANPVSIDFTSESNVAVIQEVLDFVEEGYLKYGSLLDFTSSDGFPESEVFILDTVARSMFRNERYQALPFPASSEATVVSYISMAGYISRYSEHPEACYRFLTSLSQRPELLNGLPAKRSEAMRSDFADFYDSFNQQLAEPNLLILPTSSSREDYYLSYWLFRVFDRYLLEGANLAEELAQAEEFANEYLNCLNSSEDAQSCAQSIDPTIP